jgi:hypothetical protein
MDNKKQRYLDGVQSLREKRSTRRTHVAHIQIFAPIISTVLEVIQQSLRKVQYYIADIASVGKIRVIPKSENPRQADVWLEWQRCERPKQLWVLVLRPSHATAFAQAVDEDDINFVAVFGGIYNVQPQGS